MVTRKNLPEQRMKMREQKKELPRSINDQEDNIESIGSGERQQNRSVIERSKTMRKKIKPHLRDNQINGEAKMCSRNKAK